MEKQKFKSVINGKTYRKIYSYGYGYNHFHHHHWAYNVNKRLHEHSEFIKEQPIWEGYLSLPLMDKGDKIFINEISQTVTIRERLRSTEDGDTIFYSTDHREDIEDNETKASLLRAELARDKDIDRFNEEEDKPKTSWLKRMFQ